MVSIATTDPGAGARRHATRSSAWAFVERQTNLWKRYWAWEVVWLVYGVVNTLAITFIAKQVGTRAGVAATSTCQRSCCSCSSARWCGRICRPCSTTSAS